MIINVNPMLKGKVYGFGYRHAQVKNVFIQIRIENTNSEQLDYDILQNVLARKAGIKPDNHQVFVVEQEGKYYVFQFSDGIISIGTDYVLGIW